MSVKWVKVESGQEPTATVAQRAIENQLALVWHYLLLAARESSESIDHVHQLRVATRRSVATLDAFEAFLPERKVWFYKRLKQIRRIAGEARDLDVLGLRIMEPKQPAAADDLELHDYEAEAAVLAFIRQLRQAAQKPICKLHSQLNQQEFRLRTEQLVGRIRFRSRYVTPHKFDQEPTIGQWTLYQFPKVVDQFFEATSADLQDIDLLHELRIRGKKLRYSMEIFAAVFPAKFRKKLYSRLAQLQDQLGKINDHAQAIQRLKVWLEKAGPLESKFFQQVLHEQESALTESLATFYLWWNHDWIEKLRKDFQQSLLTLGSEEQ